MDPSAKISHWNRLITSRFILEFLKTNSKNYKMGHCDWVMKHVVTNVAAQNIMLQLYLHYFYNIIFDVK